MVGCEGSGEQALVAWVQECLKVAAVDFRLQAVRLSGGDTLSMVARLNKQMRSVAVAGALLLHDSDEEEGRRSPATSERYRQAHDAMTRAGITSLASDPRFEATVARLLGQPVRPGAGNVEVDRAIQRAWPGYRKQDVDRQRLEQLLGVGRAALARAADREPLVARMLAIIGALAAIRP